MSMSLSNQAEIDNHNKSQRAKVLQSYTVAKEEKIAVPISKAEFEEQYPESTFERYSIEAIHCFRKELIKAQPDTADSVFVEATANLKPFILNDAGKQIAIFVREKEKGE